MIQSHTYSQLYWNAANNQSHRCTIYPLSVNINEAFSVEVDTGYLTVHLHIFFFLTFALPFQNVGIFLCFCSISKGQATTLFHFFNFKIIQNNALAGMIDLSVLKKLIYISVCCFNSSTSDLVNVFNNDIFFSYTVLANVKSCIVLFVHSSPWYNWTTLPKCNGLSTGEIVQGNWSWSA